MNYQGDFPEDATVLIPFNTFDSNDPAASATITNLADGDLKVHKDGSVTQIVTDGATVVINFDGITGNHMVTIDTSAHADYSTGSEYAVRMEGTTVDGATINAWIGSFSIERTGGALALAKAIKVATDKLVFTVANQLDVNVQYWIGTIVATALETAADVADAVLDEAQADHVAAGSWGEIATEIAAIKVVIDKMVFTVANQLDVNALGIAADVVDAAALSADAVSEIRQLAGGTSDAGGSTTTMIDAVRTEADDVWNGLWILFTSGAAANQTRLITDFDAATDTITFAPAVTASIGAGITYEILPAAAVDVQSWLGLVTALVAPNALIGGAVDVDVSVLQRVTLTELTSLPGASPAFVDAITFLYMATRNKRDTTASSDEIHDDADAVLAAATLSDDTVTFSKTKYA